MEWKQLLCSIGIQEDTTVHDDADPFDSDGVVTFHIPKENIAAIYTLIEVMI